MMNGKKRGAIIALIATAAAILAAAVGGIWWMATRPGAPAPTVEQTPSTTTAPTESPTVTVTFPEGFTLLQIAERLEENGVCTAEDFCRATQEAALADYPFVADIPLTDKEGQPNGRVWRLEGYLFPDTYEFYRDCGGQAALRRFLDNFAAKIAPLDEALRESGMTVDEAVTLASIVQRESGGSEEAPRMARVLVNRLQSPDYPRLQCDVTVRYVRELQEAGVAVEEAAYDTYTCRGLPVGAICSPGITALQAAIAPSDEAVCADCYYFVTDDVQHTVTYSRTYEEHLAAWRAIQAVAATAQTTAGEETK